MTIEFASLGSGSKGNATLVRAGETTVLLDCGFSVAEAGRRAARLGVGLDCIDAIFVTHEHSDHTKGVAAFSRKYNLPIYMTPATHTSRVFGELPLIRYIDNYQPITIGELTVQPVPVAHDAADPVQYVFEAKGTRFGVVTDLGCYSSRVVETFGRCHGLLLEANHDLQMLAQGPYPQFLKERVGGAWGHLNNHQARQFFNELDTDELQCLILGHISEQNNSIAKVAEVFADALNPKLEIIMASQNDGFEWHCVAKRHKSAVLLDTF